MKKKNNILFEIQDYFCLNLYRGIKLNLFHKTISIAPENVSFITLNIITLKLNE